MAVVAAFKLDDFVASGKTACQTDGGHRCFRAGADKAQLLDGRHDFSDFFGNDNFAFSRRTKRQTAQCCFAHGFNDFRMGMADNRRAPRADIVGITRAVFVPNIRAFCLFDKARYAADAAECAHRRVHAAGNNGFGAVEQAFITVHGQFFRKRSSENQIDAILTPNPFQTAQASK